MVALRRITREELRNAAWSATRFRVARRFGLSTEVFVALCARLHVPLPGKHCIFGNVTPPNLSVACAFYLSRHLSPRTKPVCGATPASSSPS